MTVLCLHPHGQFLTKTELLTLQIAASRHM